MPTTPSLTPDRARRLFRARLADIYAFLVSGLGMGIWATHIPLVQTRLGLDPAVLGIALFVMAFAATITMPLAGVALGRFGSRPTTAVLMLAFTAFLPLPLLAGTIPVFFVSLFIFGTTIGALDVSMNLQATEIEAARGRPTMSSFHGFFSVGGLAGAGLGAMIIAAGWGNGSGAALLAVLLFAVAILAGFNLWPSPRAAHAGPHFALPNRAALALGLLALLCFGIEGSVTDWSALYLATVKHASVAGAGAGFAAFSIAMAVLRLVGDTVVARLGPWTTLVGGGTLIAVGLLLAIVAPWAPVAAGGFALVGVGAANVVPVAFSGASRVPGMPSNLGVAAVTTMGYVGFLATPPLLGFVAHSFGLTASLGVVALMSAAVALIAAATTPRR
jgi:MFS family permease